MILKNTVKKHSARSGSVRESLNFTHKVIPRAGKLSGKYLLSRQKNDDRQVNFGGCQTPPRNGEARSCIRQLLISASISCGLT
jgi:hypothetical protein